MIDEDLDGFHSKVRICLEHRWRKDNGEFHLAPFDYLYDSQKTSWQMHAEDSVYHYSPKDYSISSSLEAVIFGMPVYLNPILNDYSGPVLVDYILEDSYNPTDRTRSRVEGFIGRMQDSNLISLELKLDTDSLPQSLMIVQEADEGVKFFHKI